jgi:hypothetical protein
MFCMHYVSISGCFVNGCVVSGCFISDYILGMML